MSTTRYYNIAVKTKHTSLAAASSGVKKCRRRPLWLGLRPALKLVRFISYEAFMHRNYVIKNDMLDFHHSMWRYTFNYRILVA